MSMIGDHWSVANKMSLSQLLAYNHCVRGPPLLCHHHLYELLVIDLPVAIHIGLPDHLVDLFVRQLLAQVRHHVAKLCCAYETVAISVEDLEGLDEFFLCVCVFHLP